MVDLRALSLPSTALTLVKRLDCLSSYPAIVREFAVILIPLNTDREARKINDVG